MHSNDEDEATALSMKRGRTVKAANESSTPSESDPKGIPACLR